MSDELEENDCDLALSWRHQGKPQNNISHDSQHPCCDLNRAPPKHESTALSLHQPAWCEVPWSYKIFMLQVFLYACHVEHWLSEVRQENVALDAERGNSYSSPWVFIAGICSIMFPWLLAFSHVHFPWTCRLKCMLKHWDSFYRWCSQLQKAEALHRKFVKKKESPICFMAGSYGTLRNTTFNCYRCKIRHQSVILHEACVG